MRFADYGKRVVFAAFDGGEITSGRRCPVTARTGAPDTSVRTHGGLFHRSPGSRTPNPCPSRPVGSTGLRDGARNEDIIDHDTLRFDPALKLLASPRTGPLNSPSTGMQVNGRRLPCIGSPTPCETIHLRITNFRPDAGNRCNRHGANHCRRLHLRRRKPLNDSLQWSSNLLRNRLRVMFKRLEGFAKGTPASEH